VGDDHKRPGLLRQQVWLNRLGGQINLHLAQLIDGRQTRQYAIGANCCWVNLGIGRCVPHCVCRRSGLRWWGGRPCSWSLWGIVAAIKKATQSALILAEAGTGAANREDKSQSDSFATKRVHRLSLIPVGCPQFISFEFGRREIHFPTSQTIRQRDFPPDIFRNHTETEKIEQVSFQKPQSFF
jgi:hypothetical protein